jgi:hypothetical protein
VTEPDAEMKHGIHPILMFAGAGCVIIAGVLGAWIVSSNPAGTPVQDRADGSRHERSPRETAGQEAGSSVSRWIATRESGGFTPQDPDEMKKIMPGLTILSEREAMDLPDPADGSGDDGGL